MIQPTLEEGERRYPERNGKGCKGSTQVRAWFCNAGNSKYTYSSFSFVFIYRFLTLQRIQEEVLLKKF